MTYYSPEPGPSPWGYRPPPVPPAPPVLKQPLHGAHLLATIFTLGAWGPFWLLSVVGQKHANDMNRRAYEPVYARYVEDYRRWEYEHWILRRMDRTGPTFAQLQLPQTLQLPEDPRSIDGPEVSDTAP
jgi:hypothetical protein